MNAGENDATDSYDQKLFLKLNLTELKIKELSRVYHSNLHDHAIQLVVA